MKVDISKWSGEGTFTQGIVDYLETLQEVALVRVEDAPASRSEADYNFISNEVYVAFATVTRKERVKKLGIFPTWATREEKAMTLGGLEAALARVPAIGAPDYADEGMMQFLRTERIVPPYQTRGYKLVELVRVYEVGGAARLM
jgi:hypothetical protein